MLQLSISPWYQLLPRYFPSSSNIFHRNLSQSMVYSRIQKDKVTQIIVFCIHLSSIFLLYRSHPLVPALTLLSLCDILQLSLSILVLFLPALIDFFELNQVRKWMIETDMSVSVLLHFSNFVIIDLMDGSTDIYLDWSSVSSSISIKLCIDMDYIVYIDWKTSSMVDVTNNN